MAPKPFPERTTNLQEHMLLQVCHFMVLLASFLPSKVSLNHRPLTIIQAYNFISVQKLPAKVQDTSEIALHYNSI